jgi:DUF4097 and DUF4098 domain-containing protein YvlB
MKIFASLLLCCVLSLSVAFAQDHSFRESYPMSVPASLYISSSDGNIDVTSSSGNEIEVFYIVKRGNRLLKTSKKELEREDNITVDVSHEKNSLRIVVKYPNSIRGFNWNDQVSVSFSIKVPKQTSADLNTSDGNVGISGLSGDQQCKTSDGNIRLADIVGNVVGATSDGNVHADKIRGSLEIKTSDGDIDLTEINGRTSVRTSDGNISFRNLAGSFSGTTSDGNIRGNILELKTELAAKTGDGNISVTIPDKLGLDLDIHGESLNVPLANFTGNSDEKTIRGKANGGGIAVNLSTSDGNITLVYQ